MIIDRIENLQAYSQILPTITQAIKTLDATKSAHTLGQPNTFDGGYLTYFENDTLPAQQAYFEAHQRYVDIQLILEGKESMAWANIHDLPIHTAYDSDKDIAFYSGPNTQHFVVEPGIFYIAFPWDGHQPGIHFNHPSHYKKVVVKLEWPVK